jgi:hypothetical protein
VLSDAERALLSRLGEVVLSPRAAKRLVNIYRMLRVSVPADEQRAFMPGGGDEYQAVVLLLAILIALPDRADEVFAALAASRDDAGVWAVLERFPDVAARLGGPLREHLTVRLEACRRWAPRVARFSFGYHAAGDAVRFRATGPGSASQPGADGGQ